MVEERMGPLAFHLRTKGNPSIWNALTRSTSWTFGLSRSFEEQESIFRDRVTTAVYEGLWDPSPAFITEG